MERENLTVGSVPRILYAFAVPFLLANLLQSLYGAVDLLIVGAYCSPASVAAVSTGTQVTQIVTSLVSGLTLGSTVLIGNEIGRGNRDRVKKIMGTTFTAFFGAALLLTAAMLIFEKQLLRLLDTPKESFQRTVIYVSICAWGNVFICEYNAVSAVLRGYGDSRSPLRFVAIACSLNVVLDLVFVKYLHMDVAGTALATVISQGVSMITAVLHLKKGNFLFDFRLKSFRPERQIVKELLKIGIPISFQELLIRISFLYIAYAMNRCGLYAAAVVGIGAKYDVFAMLTSNSMAGALTAFTAQNMGAGKPQRARRALWLCIGTSLCASALFFLWAQYSPGTMIGVFSRDPGVIAAGIPYLRSSSWDYLMVALVFCLNGYLNGRQKTLWTMLSSTFSAVVLRMPMTWLFIRWFDQSLGAIGTVAPVVTGITAVYTLLYVLWEKKGESGLTNTGKSV